MDMYSSLFTARAKDFYARGLVGRNVTEPRLRGGENIRAGVVPAFTKEIKMYDLKIRYLASAFVDAESIVADATHALEFLKELGNDKFLPTIFHELSPSVTIPLPRLGFRTLDDTANIMFMSNRFDYSLSSKNPEGSDLGGFTNFCQQAKNILTLSLNFFQRKSIGLVPSKKVFLDR
jgi:hypothetical protein